MRADAQATRALMIDPGEEPQRLLDAAAALGVEIEAILITHCHFDHIGAVAPVARATGAPVYCPEIELGVLADIMKWTMPGFGPFESWQAEHTVKGGERLRLADMDVEVLFTPGHSPGHMTYAIDRASASDGIAVSAEDRGGSASAEPTGAALRRRALPGLGRPRGPARRRLGDAGALDRHADERFERDTVVYPGTWA